MEMVPLPTLKGAYDMQVKVTIDPVVLEMDIEGETMEECEQEAIDTVLQHWEVEVVGDDPNEESMHKTFTDDEVIEAIQGGLEIAKEKGVTLNAEQEAFIEDPEQDADVKRMRDST